jgi:superfamily II DNA or RNA helicase
MKIGLYEEIVNSIISRKIESISCSPIFEPLEVVDSHDYLAQYLYRVLAQGLAQVKPEQGIEKESDKLKSRLNRQVSICNEIIQVLANRYIEGIDDYKVSDQAQRLIAILEEVVDKKAPSRPDTPLALGSLLTGIRQDPSLISQIKKEISSADKIDMLVSFIKWSGVMLMKEQLENFTKDNKLRIITTSYMGATDLKAIKWLESLPNTEVKISYDTHRTRLHAKAFSFYRETGFSSAYVGSANVSQAAFTDGLEWTVKISQYEQPYQWKKITATFDTYWNDSEFETFHAVDELRLKRALSDERNQQNEDFVLPNFDLKPYGFQKEILDQIQVERQLQKITKHLIVAATGTGKTMIAAFDFKQWRSDFKNNQGSEPKLLFVAHRKEILKQSLMTFRAVLRDQNYGDLMVGGNQPEQSDQLFISIQSYNSKELSEVVDAQHYNYIVVDEFHHAAANSYRTLLEHVEPDSLLGLTATPERADGKEITLYFDDHITAEIRLPDAINRKLLCPFHYYGISDSADFSTLTWSRGGYVPSEISNLLTGDDRRAQLIIEKTAEIALDVLQTRGLGFCVSKNHAEFMCKKFNDANIPSAFLTSDTNSQDRNNVKSCLINKQINFIFVVDIYNEGVDIPEIDTVLFLRPTESLTVFLQQLGRGLRLNDDKDCLTVLDFVGQSHKNFRYDLRFNALNSNTKNRIDEELNEEFPHLPAGCSIQLERKAKEHILNNIQQALFRNRTRIIQHIQSFVSDTGLKLTLENFLTYYRMQPDEIYKRGAWSRLCVLAGEKEDFTDPDEEQLAKGFRRLLHINDDVFISNILAWLDESFNENSLSDNDIKRLSMLHFTLWNNSFKAKSVMESFKRLDANPVLKDELKELLQLCKNAIASLPETISLPFDTPLRLHGRYTLNEILGGLGRNTLEKQPAMREGVLHLKEINTDAFFITINKSEKHYSTTTLYDDYAISDKLFHWQSQSNTSVESPTGKRYIEHQERQQTILLFIREERSLKGGLAEPYYFIGPATYVSHEGSRPIGFIWELEHSIPAHLVREAAHLSIS